MFLQKNAHIRGSVPNINKSLNGCFCLGGPKFCFFRSAQHRIDPFHLLFRLFNHNVWLDDVVVAYFFRLKTIPRKFIPPTKVIASSRSCCLPSQGITESELLTVSQLVAEKLKWTARQRNSLSKPLEFVWDGPITYKTRPSYALLKLSSVLMLFEGTVVGGILVNLNLSKTERNLSMLRCEASRSNAAGF